MKLHPAILPIEYVYEVDVELNFTDFETLEYLKLLLHSNTFVELSSPSTYVSYTSDVTTVCSQNGTNFQCRCEEQYAWSNTSCNTYGACDWILEDWILGDTCHCINSIPTNGQYCQPKTVPPILYEYQIFIEVITPDADKLRNTLNNTPFPIQISTQLNITEANITTVCSQNDTEIQCQCEDDHLWPCDTCATYGTCDGDTTGTCGCITAFPDDGQYCQSVHHQIKLRCGFALLQTFLFVAPDRLHPLSCSNNLSITNNYTYYEHYNTHNINNHSNIFNANCYTNNYCYKYHNSSNHNINNYSNK
ncbi:Adhesion G protein-coupled receptor F5 [Liparis tanakae]|uniref:Adhesion G protein-coupled receptor F5 n=1 Tax=Liparis tanakae TaxID=230148 RepID=A0A4Z2J451_9TELE|nr:Adhesion G protein-coupled receptor F5 [Liparis tanakae]